MNQNTNHVLFTELIEQHHGIINKALNTFGRNSYEDDLRQEVLFEAWKAFPNYRAEAKFSTWLFAVARNAIVSYFRVASNKFQSSFIGFCNQGHDYPWDEYIEYDPPALDMLSERERECFLLYAEGMSYEQMAEKMGEPENRLRVRISRIRQMLKKHMRKHFFT